MASNAHPALSVPEIIERIFLQCDMKTLLVSAQRVCRDWRFIAEAPAVQKHLFFTADALQMSPTPNPILGEFFSEWFPGGASISSQSLRNPDGVPSFQAHRVKAFTYEDASWRRMLIQQPPIASFVRCVTSLIQPGMNLRVYSVPDGNAIDIHSQNWIPTMDKDARLPEPMNGQPIRMETFYRLVMEAVDSVDTQMFVWSYTDGWEAEVKGQLYWLDIDRLAVFRNFAMRDGLIQFQLNVGTLDTFYIR